MSDWIPFEDATYQVEQAFVVAADKDAVVLEQTLVTVYTGKGGKKYLSGTGLISNILLVELLEESDDLDMILDLGGEYKYFLKTPKMSAGKVFSPDIKSSLQFSPTTPWQQIPKPDFDVLISRLKLL